MAAAAATTLPPPAEAKITAMGTKCLGKELYDFQKEVIYALVYKGKSVLVLAVRKTGGGKTAVMIGAGLMMEVFRSPSAQRYRPGRTLGSASS